MIADRTGAYTKTIRPLRRRASAAAPPISMARCIAARRMAACWPMISRPANASGKPPSPIRNAAKARQPRRSPGMASSSSATPAATSRASRAGCMRSTPRPAKSSGNSISFPKRLATSSAGRKPIRRSTPRPGKCRTARRSPAERPGPPIRSIPTKGCSTCPAAIPRRISARTCARAKISIPVRSSCSTPRPATTRPISRSFRRTGTIGTCPRRRC